MSNEKYIGLDVHQATISVAVTDSQGKVVIESILETKASTLLEFFAGLRGSLFVTFEEGTWAAVVVALLVRPFGVRLPLNPLSFRKRRSAFQSLTPSQHMWIFGVLQWGCSMFIYTTLWDYLDWKYLNGPLHDLTAGWISGRAILWFTLGLIMGGVTWKGNMNKTP